MGRSLWTCLRYSLFPYESKGTKDAYRFSQSNGSSTSNLSLTLTKGFGRAVSKIQYACFNNNEFGPYALDNNSSQSCKVALKYGAKKDTLKEIILV